MRSSMNSGLIHTYYYYNIGSKQGNKTTCNKVWVHRLGAHARLSNTRGAVEDVDTMISNIVVMKRFEHPNNNIANNDI